MAPAPNATAAGQAKLDLITSAGGVDLSTPSGIAVDRTGADGVIPGDIYVADLASHRVTQLRAEGEFVATFGKGVNQTTGG